jgi:hypothetical protein
MRFMTLATLAMLGLLSVGATFAAAQVRPVNAPAAPAVTTVADEAVITFVRRPVYRSAPGWYTYDRYPPYSVYGPRYWYAPPRYRAYYDYPYRDYYYYPDGVGFEYYGPRASFRFGF